MTISRGLLRTHFVARPKSATSGLLKRIVVAAVLALPAAQAWSQRYTLSLLEALPGGTVSYASGINEAGQVVGRTSTSTGPAQAVVWNGLVPARLDAPGGQQSGATAIADNGTVVGYGYNFSLPRTLAAIWTPEGANSYLSDTRSGSSVAFSISAGGHIVGQWEDLAGISRATVWNNGSRTTFTGLGGSWSAGYAINSHGVAVGLSYLAGDSESHATLWRGVETVDLGTLGGTRSSALGINDHGQSVGYAYRAGFGAQPRAVLWNGREIVDFGGDGNEFSIANSINNAGAIVGVHIPLTPGVPGTQHAVMWDANTGVRTDLNSLLDEATLAAGWLLVEAHDINEQGWIVGDARNTFSGALRGFVLSPVPEPGAVVLWAVGLGLVAVRTQRTRLRQ
jgi:uncharacterized membrane protein